MTSAYLSGGTGKLTDGAIPTLNYDSYGRNTPYMGWCGMCFPNETNPNITFNFANTVTINSVSVWADNLIGISFDVSSTVTPEPATMTLLASGIALGCWHLRKVRT